jgi:hypothetical protein
VKDGSDDIPVTANFTLKKVPFEVSDKYEDENGVQREIGYGICDEKLFVPMAGSSSFISMISVIYFDINGVEMWGYMLSSIQETDASFVQDEIDIIRI